MKMDENAQLAALKQVYPLKNAEVSPRRFDSGLIRWFEIYVDDGGLLVMKRFAPTNEREVVRWQFPTPHNLQVAATLIPGVLIEHLAVV